MIVPNYIPDPLEVPRNVTEEPYHVRVAFLRRVTVLHSLGLVALGLLACLPWPRVGLEIPLVGLALVLVGLDIWRIRQRGNAIEAKVSATVLPVVLALTAWSVREGNLLGWPTSAPLAGAACALAYTLFAGRDYSFVGCTFLALIGSSVAIAGLSLRYGLDATHATFALTANALYLLYFEYDLASLLARRRQGEEWAAVVDLYRDIFNFFGYAIRCIRHWRKHRIWEITRN